MTGNYVIAGRALWKFLFCFVLLGPITLILNLTLIAITAEKKIGFYKDVLTLTDESKHDLVSQIYIDNEG